MKNVWRSSLLARGSCAAASIVAAGLLAAPPALAQGATQWRVTYSITVVGRSCGEGDRGTVKVNGKVLGIYEQGMSYPQFEVELEPDGSANKTVGEHTHPNRKVQVKIPAGDKPRTIEAMFVDSWCGYRYTP